MPQQFNSTLETNEATGEAVPGQGSGDIGGTTELQDGFSPDGSDDADFMAVMGDYASEPHDEQAGIEEHDAGEPDSFTPTEPEQTKAETKPEPSEEEAAFPGADEPGVAEPEAAAPERDQTVDQSFMDAFGLKPEAVESAQAAMGDDFKQILGPQTQPGSLPIEEQSVLPIAPREQTAAEAAPVASSSAQAPAPGQTGSGEQQVGFTDQQSQQLIDEYGDAIKPALDQIQTVSKKLTEHMERVQTQTEWFQRQQVAEARTIVEAQLVSFEAGPLKDVYGAQGARSQDQQKAVNDLTSLAADYQVAKHKQGHPVTDAQAIQAAIWGQHRDVLNTQAASKARDDIAAKVERRQRVMDVSGSSGSVGRRRASPTSTDAFMQSIAAFQAA